MKTFALFVAAMGLPFLTASAQLPPRTSFTLDVLQASNGGDGHIKNSSNEMDTLTQKRGKATSGDLDITVRNLGKVAETATLEWHFLANPLQKGKPTHIFNSGSQEISLVPGAETKVEAKSPVLKSTIKKTQKAGDDMSKIHKSGADFDGWIVRLVIGGQPALVKASSAPLENAGKSNEQLAALKK